jgi:hypothetical protein
VEITSRQYTIRGQSHLHNQGGTPLPQLGAPHAARVGPPGPSACAIRNPLTLDTFLPNEDGIAAKTQEAR